MDLNADGRLDILSGCYSVQDAEMKAPVWVLYRTEAGDFAGHVGQPTAPFAGRQVDMHPRHLVLDEAAENLARLQGEGG